MIPYGRQCIDQDDIDAVVDTLKSDFLTTGPKVEEFEQAIADYCGAKYCVAVSNGTAASHLASLILLKKGTKVLTTPNSFLSTSNSILYAGAKPVFVDIRDDGNIDLDLCEVQLKKDSNITAIYPVAFSGKPINQSKLKYLREKYHLNILEDCAHAIGSIDSGIKTASSTNSDCSILSFHPVKHLTTAEGGAITTNSKEIFEKLLVLRSHGMVKSIDMKPWEYEMQELGFNYRITDMQCSLGLSQIKKLDSFLLRRRQLAKQYDLAFEDTEVRPLYSFDKNSAYHLYVVLIDFKNKSISKEDLFIKLKEKNIGVQLHYIPINKQPYYRNLGYGNEPTPVMDKYYEQCLSLPLYPLLTDSQQDYVVSSIIELLHD